MGDTLIIIWAGLISFIIAMYVMLDGFDLGVGILFPFVDTEQDRDAMMNAVAPMWDGNETWMVLGAACLYGVFPIAYSTILPDLYLPIFVMLAAFIFRGVSFEFRHKKHSHKQVWSVSFFLSSLIITLMQGLIVGTLVQGVQGEMGFDVFNPFSIVAAIGLVFGYCLLGSAWIIKKTSGSLQEKMYQFCKRCIYFIIIIFVVVSLWIPYLHPHIYNKWFDGSNIIMLIAMPFLALITVLYLYYSLIKKHEHQPFFLGIALFVLALISQLYSVWPYVVPFKYTFYEAAASTGSLKFLLVGITILLPILIAYNLYGYWVFRGKVSELESY